MTDWYVGVAKIGICREPDCTKDHKDGQSEYKLMKYNNFYTAKLSLASAMNKASGGILVRFGLTIFIEIMEGIAGLNLLTEKDLSDKVYNPMFGDWVFVMMNKLPSPEEDIHYSIVADHTHCTDDRCEAVYYDDPAKQN